MKKKSFFNRLIKITTALTLSVVMLPAIFLPDTLEVIAKENTSEDEQTENTLLEEITNPLKNLEDKATSPSTSDVPSTEKESELPSTPQENSTPPSEELVEEETTGDSTKGKGTSESDSGESNTGKTTRKTKEETTGTSESTTSSESSSITKNGLTSYRAPIEFVPSNLYLDLPGKKQDLDGGFGTEFLLQVYPYRFEKDDQKIPQLFSFYIVLPKGFSINASDTEIQEVYVRKFLDRNKEPDINFKNFTSLDLHHLTTETGQDVLFFVPNKGASASDAVANMLTYATLELPIRIMDRPKDLEEGKNIEIFFNNDRMNSRINVGAIYISEGNGPTKGTVYPVFPVEETGIIGAPDEYLSSIKKDDPKYGRRLILKKITTIETYNLYDSKDKENSKPKLLASFQISGESGTTYNRSELGINTAKKWLDNWKTDASSKELYDFSTLEMEEGEGGINGQDSYTPTSFDHPEVGKTYKVYISQKVPDVTDTYTLYDMMDKNQETKTPLAVVKVTGKEGSEYIPSEKNLNKIESWQQGEVSPTTDLSLYDFASIEIKSNNADFNEFTNLSGKSVDVYIKQKSATIKIMILTDSNEKISFTKGMLEVYQNEALFEVDSNGNKIEESIPDDSSTFVAIYSLELPFDRYKIKFTAPKGYKVKDMNPYKDGIVALKDTKDTTLIISLSKGDTEPIKAPINISTQDTDENSLKNVDLTITDLTDNNKIITKEDGSNYQTDENGKLLFEGEEGHQYEITGIHQEGFKDPKPVRVTGSEEEQNITIQYEKEEEPFENVIPQTGSKSTISLLILASIVILGGFYSLLKKDKELF